jgi:hypothetical protein
VGENELGLGFLDRCPFYTAETHGWSSIVMNGSDWKKPASDGMWAWSPPGIEGKHSGLGLFRPGFAGLKPNKPMKPQVLILIPEFLFQ